MINHIHNSTLLFAACLLYVAVTSGLATTLMQ